MKGGVSNCLWDRSCEEFPLARTHTLTHSAAGRDAKLSMWVRRVLFLFVLFPKYIHLVQQLFICFCKSWGEIINLFMKIGNGFLLLFQLTDIMHKKEIHIDPVSSKTISRSLLVKGESYQLLCNTVIISNLFSWRHVITTSVIVLRARPFWENIYRAMWLFCLHVKRCIDVPHVTHHIQ